VEKVDGFHHTISCYTSIIVSSRAVQPRGYTRNFGHSVEKSRLWQACRAQAQRKARSCCDLTGNPEKWVTARQNPRKPQPTPGASPEVFWKPLYSTDIKNADHNAKCNNKLRGHQNTLSPLPTAQREGGNGKGALPLGLICSKVFASFTYHSFTYGFRCIMLSRIEQLGQSSMYKSIVHDECLNRLLRWLFRMS
jgi:hypothetical protein